VFLCSDVSRLQEAIAGELKTKTDTLTKTESELEAMRNENSELKDEVKEVRKDLTKLDEEANGYCSQSCERFEEILRIGKEHTAELEHIQENTSKILRDENKNHSIELTKAFNDYSAAKAVLEEKNTELKEEVLRLRTELYSEARIEREEKREQRIHDFSIIAYIQERAETTTKIKALEAQIAAAST
jgi:predicted  nucleic acid-binding Zn-ribbon protein